MLDIVMVAHKPNYVRMAHRGLTTNGALTQSSILGCLPAAVSRTTLNGKIVLSLEGGKHKDFEAAEAYLDSQNLPWQIVHSDVVTTYREALIRGIEQCSSPMVAVIPSWIEITDPLWVQRMTWAFSKDAACLLCGTGPEEGPARDMAPFVAKPRVWPGGDFFVARRQDLVDMLRLATEGEFYDPLVRANAWRVWVHPGVRFKIHEHDDHKQSEKAQGTVGSSAGSDS